jgi:hypothetical protein
MDEKLKQLIEREKQVIKNNNKKEVEHNKKLLENAFKHVQDNLLTWYSEHIDSLERNGASSHAIGHFYVFSVPEWCLYTFKVNKSYRCGDFVFKVVRCGVFESELKLEVKVRRRWWKLW